MIEITRLTKSLSGEKVLDNINLKVTDGELVVILGESGAGKSVLLKHLMGLIKPDQGSVKIDSVDIARLSEKELLRIRGRIGYLFQEGALYDFMNVFENVAFPLKEHTDFNHQTISRKVKDILKVVDLEGIEEKYPSELSGGMKKRVGLARAIVLDCKIILCDEPTSGLDPIRSRDISDLIKNVSKQMNCTTVMTSHDIANSFRIADRVALVRNGRLLVTGSPSELESCEDAFVKEFIS